MKDRQEADEKRLDELAELRKQVAELKTSEARRKKAEKILEDTNARLQAILDTIAEHINIIAPDGTVLWRNTDSGKCYPNCVGRKCWEVFEHRSNRCPHCVHPQILADGKPRDYETRVMYRDGTFTDWWVRAVPLRDNSGKIYAVLEAAADFTERKRAERTIKDLMKSKSDFISAVSNKLGMPLNSVKEDLAVVLDELAGSTNDEQKKLLGAVKTSVDKLAGLIDSVSDPQKFFSLLK